MTTKVKCLIYIAIASITAITTDISNYQSFDDITPIKLTHLILNVLLQGLIALRAFLDQSISKDIETTKDNQISN